MKKKKHIKKRIYIILIILIYLTSFFVTIKYSYRKKNSSEVVRYLLENNNHYIKKKEKKEFVSKLVEVVAGIDFSNPLTLINNNYDSEEEIDKKIEFNYVPDPYPEKEVSEPIVYLYNTHQQEEYALSNSLEYNVKPTVMTLSYILREKLNKNGINTIVEENNISEFLQANSWNYAASYKASRILLDDIKEKEPTLKYFIDLHRDSVNKNISSVSIDNINYAKILFIVGLENSNYKENLAFTEKLNNMFNDRYPNLSRGIYKKQGKGVNGVYNQDFNPNTILIEVGGQDNTIDEVFNTAEAIANVLTSYIKENEDEK